MDTHNLEKQVEKWIAAFESLTKNILESKSAKNYKELLDFFVLNLKCEQIFLWRKTATVSAAARTSGKQKFLSLNKVLPQEFEIYHAKFESVQFNQQGYYSANGELYLKVNISEDEYLCLIFKSFSNDILKNNLLFTIFLARLTGVLHLVERFAQTQGLSYVDDVTGLYNQRYLHVLLDQEIERFKRQTQPFSILFIDVDHFKNVNDKNGHLVGSLVLKEIGAILKKSVRAVDFCFRYGGDEFIIVLTSTETEQALAVAERVCKTVHDTTFLINRVNVKVTLSIGVAGFPEHAQTKEKIIQVADEAMYCGKNLSRNVVYVAS